MGFSKQEYWSGVPLPSPANVARVPQYIFVSLQSVMLPICIQVHCSSSQPLFHILLGPQSQCALSSAFLYLESSHSGCSHLVTPGLVALIEEDRDLVLYSPCISQNALPQARQRVGTQSILADRSQRGWNDPYQTPSIIWELAD